MCLTPPGKRWRMGKTRVQLSAAKTAGLASSNSNTHGETRGTGIMDVASRVHICIRLLQVEDFKAQSDSVGLVRGGPVLITVSSPWQS